MNRRNFLQSAAVGVGTVGAATAITGTAQSWQNIQIDAYCKSHHYQTLAKFEVGGGEFEMEYGGRREGENVWRVWNGGYELEVEPTRVEEGEIREFAFDAADQHVGSSIGVVEVKGGPDTERFLDNPLSDTSGGTGLHAPVNSNASRGDSEQYYGVSYAAFKPCYDGFTVDVTGTQSSARPADVIDVANDEVRLAITYESWRHDDQYLFDNGTDVKHGGREIRGDGQLHFYFPLADAFVDDPDEVGNPSGFVAKLLVESDDGDTWIGTADIPTVV